VITVKNADIIVLQPQYQPWIIGYIGMSLIIVMHPDVSMVMRVAHRWTGVVVTAVIMPVDCMPAAVAMMAVVMLRVFTVVMPVYSTVSSRPVVIRATAVVLVRLAVTRPLIGFIMVACTGKYRG
jgi:hypothetical protein